MDVLDKTLVSDGGFCRTHGQNKTRKCDNEGFVPVASLCGVVGNWWDLEGISADAGTQFTSTVFKEEFQTSGVRLTFAAPENQEMNRQVEVTWRTLRIVAYALMVHARVPEIYLHFALMYTTDHIFSVLQIKDLI